jgi:hypothetical protein
MLKLILTLCLSALIGLSGPSWAQQPGVPGPRMHYGTMWDANSVTTVSGVVAAIEQYIPGRGGSSYGLRFTLKTGKETLPIILGPASYVEQQQFAIAPQDTVEVKGSRLSLQGQDTIIAQEVKKGDQVLKLRDPKGAPLWSGPR